MCGDGYHTHNSTMHIYTGTCCEHTRCPDTHVCGHFPVSVESSDVIRCHDVMTYVMFVCVPTTVMRCVCDVMNVHGVVWCRTLCSGTDPLRDRRLRGDERHALPHKRRTWRRKPQQHNNSTSHSTHTKHTQSTHKAHTHTHIYIYVCTATHTLSHTHTHTHTAHTQQQPKCLVQFSTCS